MFVILLGGCTTTDHRAVSKNRETICCYFEEWANRGNAAMTDRLIATNLVLRNLEEYKTGMAKFHSAFQDARYTVDEHMAKGDKAVVRWAGCRRGNPNDHPLSCSILAVTSPGEIPCNGQA